MIIKTGILLNNPFGFKFDREPACMTDCFEMALHIIESNYPMHIIETRSLDQLLLRKNFERQYYWQYPFVMTGYEGDGKMRRDLFVYFFLLWCRKKNQPRAFPFEAYHRAFEKIEHIRESVKG
jgi:hypothetical protein